MIPTLRRRSRTAFTLVEVLVAITVLSLMMAAMASVMAFVTKTWLAGINTVDNFTKARTMLNLLDRDIQMMVLRRDLGAFVDQTGANPACAFYANVQGYTGVNDSTNTRSVSLLLYTNTLSDSVAQLQRFNYGMNYLANSPTVGTTNALSQLSTLSASTSGTSEVLSTGVVAFKWQFIDGNGSYQTPPTSSPFIYNFANPASPTNYRVAVVSLVVLSNNAYKLATQTGTLTQVQTNFPSALPSGSPNQSFATYWNGLLNPATGSFGSSLPAPIRGPGSIQVFERHIPLPVTTPSN